MTCQFTNIVEQEVPVVAVSAWNCVKQMNDRVSANVEQMNNLMVEYDYPSNCNQGVRRRETALLFSSMYNDTNIRRNTLNKVCRSLFTLWEVDRVKFNRRFTQIPGCCHLWGG